MINSALALEWSPLLPAGLLLGLAGLAVLLCGFALWRRARGVGWRCGFAVVVLLALANPSLVEEQRDPLPDIALVVVDESASQDIAPRPDQVAEALGYLEAQLDGFNDLEVRRIRAGRGALSRGEEGTRLFADIRRALAEIPSEQLSGVILLSDGQVHDVPEAETLALAAAPFHVLLSGEEDEGDRRLKVVRAPSYGIVGKPQSLTLRVDDLGEAGSTSRSARLLFSQNGAPPVSLTLPIGVEIDVPFELDRRGQSVLELELEPAPRELTLANNQAAVTVNGVRDRLRVLLVSGEPHPGERAWRSLLKSDPSVDLVHFTILRPPEKQDGTPIRELSLIAFPTRELFEVKLDEFDLIIFDRYRRRGVLPQIYLGNVADYVEQGGALLEAVGPSFASPLSLSRTPLGAVLPTRPTGQVFERGFKPRITEIGYRHPVTAGLPGAGGSEGLGATQNGEPEWGRWFRQVEGEVERGLSVMSGVEDSPLLLLDRVGEGRVAQLLSDHLWLWARGFEGGGPQDELLRRVAHWLMKEPELEEEDLRASITGGRLEVTRRSLSPEPMTVTVEAPDGSISRLPLEPSGPGRFAAGLEVDQIGIYRVRDGDHHALAAAGALNPVEYENVLSSAAALEPLVRAKGGTIARLAADRWPSIRRVAVGRDAAGSSWMGLRENDAFRVTGVERTPLLPGILALLLALGAVGAAWHREGR